MGSSRGATLEEHETGPRKSRNENEWNEALICFATCAGIQARWSSRKPLKAVKSLATMGKESQHEWDKEAAMLSSMLRESTEARRRRQLSCHPCRVMRAVLNIAAKLIAIIDLHE